MSSITIGIIGGTGSMGRWFSSFFSEAGHKVLISGRKTELVYKEMVKKSDVIILSVPIDAAINITKEIGPMLSKDQLLSDFCSLKENITKNMLSFSSAEVVGTHPLFGPYTDSIKGKNIIICPGRGNHWLSWLECEFQKKGAIITRMQPHEHDNNMAVIQGLTHFITVCMGRTLQKMKMLPEQAMCCSTPIFRINLDLIGRLFAQDLELYSNLIGKNKYVHGALQFFLSSVDEAKKNLLSENNENALSFLSNIKKFLGDDFCNSALKESNLILKFPYSNSSNVDK